MAIQSIENSSTRYYRVSDPAHPRADHANNAMTPNGTIGVIYHYGTTRKSVVFRAYEYQGKAFIPTQPITIAAPDSKTYAQDSCQKPWIVALGDGSFVACWTRKDTSAQANSTTPNAQVEVTRIYRKGGDWLTTPITVVDDQVAAGDADVMPRLQSIKDRFVALAYVTQTKNNPVTGGTTREYDLRLVYHDWNANQSQSPREVKLKQYQAIRMDDTSANPFASSSGGLILPSMATDQHGDILLAYEEYQIDGGGVKTPAIQLKRLTGPYHSAPFTELETLSFNPASNTTTLNPVRRPMLASQDPQGVVTDDSVLLATGVQDPADPDGGYSVAARITLDQGAMSITELTLPANQAYDGTHASIQATAAMSPTAQLIADTAYHDAANESSHIRLLHVQADDSIVAEAFPGPSLFFVKRPALTFHRMPMSERFLAMTYEGGLDASSTSRFVAMTVFGY